MRIIFLGPPGVGKGTQSQRLANYLHIPQISTGEMIRKAIADQTPIGLLSESFIRTGKLVPDPVIVKMLGERLANDDCRPGFLLDGFPRTIGQATVLDEYLRDQHAPLSAAISLSVDREEIVRRLAGRNRDDDKPEVIRERLMGYERDTAPLLSFYEAHNALNIIDGMGTPDEVTARINAVVDKLKK
jgi:adenylate kinase